MNYLLAIVVVYSSVNTHLSNLIQTHTHTHTRRAGITCKSIKCERMNGSKQKNKRKEILLKRKRGKSLRIFRIQRINV